MSRPHDPDQQFHENLEVLGRCTPVPPTASAELRARCAAELDRTGARPVAAGRTLWRRPALLSTLGMAASIALFVGLFFPWNGAPRVEAAMILEKLDQQMTEGRLLKVSFDSITVDEVSLNGFLQVAESALAGNVRVVITDEGETGPLEVDVSLAISPGDGWVLVRKLEIPDPQVAAILSFVFPPGSETLVILPADATAGSMDLNLDETLKELSSGKLVDTLKTLIQSHSQVGATVEDQADGTILLTLPIDDAEALESLEELFEGMDDEAEHAPGHLTVSISSGSVAGVDESDEEADEEPDGYELIGSTLEIVYDPDAEQVRSFAITDFGVTEGTLSVAIEDGEIDPALLDSSRVATEATRTIDLNAIMSILEQFDDGDSEH